MEKIQVTTEENRYEVRRHEVFGFNFRETVVEVSELKEEDFKVFFNTNNTGLNSFSNRLMEAEERSFSTVEEIKELAKELEMPHYTMISFYRENGYYGVYENREDDCFQRRCSNWVNSGADGLLFVLFTKEEKHLSLFTSNLQTYINEGFYQYEIYDKKEDEFLDSFIDNDNYQELKEWKKKMIETYGFEERDFDI